MASKFHYLKLALFVALSAVTLVSGQDSKDKTCQINEIFNGQSCVCAPGYFSTSNKSSKDQCEAECDEQYFSYFTYGTCASIQPPKPGGGDQKPNTCNLKCGVRLRLVTIIGIFAVFAAAIATLVFTIPMCIATCASCLHSKSASKHSKRVYVENQQPNKDQQLAAMSYNPYAYWPYYGR